MQGCSQCLLLHVATPGDKDNDAKHCFLPSSAGYGKGGLLTEAIRRHPHCVVVLDDLERAHPDVVGLLLQVSTSDQHRRHR